MPRKLIDMTGRTFSRLTVSEIAGTHVNGECLWSCACTCGGLISVTGSKLRSGHTQSCGCLRNEHARSIARTASLKHGHAPIGRKSPTYRSWQNMLERCANPKNRAYARYGGRGIQVCERWRKFEHFLLDLGERPNKHFDLSRDDHDIGYQLGNASWAPRKKNRQEAGRRGAIARWKGAS